ncbi:MAG: ATP-binding protein [Bacilli bacterium]|nr:ATP-binding protein [Bacilli bacterium]
MIKRDYYLNQIIKREWDGNIKVITGIRRCGKSVLLFELFKDYLTSKGIETSQIIEIKLDKMDYIKYRNPFYLYKQINKIITLKKYDKYYLFIDEIQMAIKKKDRQSGVTATIYDILNGFRDNKLLDVYVTGSNSKMLSTDIATEFRGRSSRINVHPLSFKEYFEYIGGDEQKALNEYMILGGMPGLIHEQTEEDKKMYLKNLYDEIYIKDIVERNKIKREDILNDILNYLASQISSLTNITRIANAISSFKKENITHEMVDNYVKHIKNSMLISESQRYDIKGKSFFSYPSKFYYEDTGLRNARLNYRQIEPGHLMENILYNELIRRGFTVDVGAVPIREANNVEYVEIDFIVNKLDTKIYIQSAFQMLDANKVNQETRPFMLTNDFFKKVIIRNDIINSFYDEQGIYHCRLIDFLLDKVDFLN